MPRKPNVSILEILLSVFVIAVVIVLSIYFWYTANNNESPNDEPASTD